MKHITLALFFVASVSFAHVEPGTYRGVTADGAECSMTAGETYYEGGVKHPLNERIKIQVDGVEILVGHPPVVDAAQSLAYFNHDLFQGVIPTATGAKAVVIEMSHEEGKDGPQAFTFIENKWKAGEKRAIACQQIKLVK